MKNALLLIDWIGCPRNMLLKQRIQDYLAANGWEMALPKDIAGCGLVIFCTCGFTQVQQRRSLLIVQAVHNRIARLKHPPLFAITGCVPPMGRADLGHIHQGPAFGPLEIDRLDGLIGARVKMADIPEPTRVPAASRIRRVVEPRYGPLLNALERIHGGIVALRRAATPNAAKDFDNFQMGAHTWSVETSKGCLGKCSYCIIPKAKGRLNSRPLKAVVESVRQGLASGYDQVALIADDNGAYGKDIGTDFGVLLKELNRLGDRFNLLVDSLSAHHFIEFFEGIRQSCRLGKVPRLMLALQHVDDAILASMKRPYDVALLKSRLAELASDIPTLVIHAHVMIGYPGETAAAFDRLTGFLRWLLRLNPLNEFRAWTYSPNPGTPAADMVNRVPEIIVRKRQIAVGKIHTRRAYVLGRGESTAILPHLRSLGVVMPLFFAEKTVLWLKRLLEYEVLSTWFRPARPLGTPLGQKAGDRQGIFF